MARKGRQKGPQQHAEGQQGDKTHRQFIENLHHAQSDADDRQQSTQGPESGSQVEGHHRLFEDRQQHDEAELNSEKNRGLLARERGTEVNGRTVDDSFLNGDLHS